MTYVHVELDRHDAMLAEGLATESYLDCGQRADFEGQAVPMTLHPMFASLSHEGACAPFEIAGPVLDATRAMLERRADRLEARGGLLSRLLARRAG